MKFSEQMNFINYIENNLNVDQWIIDEICIWPLVRIQLGIQLSYNEFKFNNKSSYFGKLGRMKELAEGHLRFLKAKIVDNSNNQSLANKREVVFLGDQVSRVMLNDTWYDRFCNPFIEQLEKLGVSSFHMEPLHQYKTPRYSPSFFIQPYLDYLTIRSINRHPTLYNDLPFVDDFLKFQNILRDSNISFIYSDINYLAKIISRLKLYSEWFRNLMLKVCPNIGFVVGYYGIEGMAFNLACLKLGIPSVDIQHGVHGDLHYAYNRWESAPEQGYELLPTYFWCWSQSEADKIDNWTRYSKRHKPIVGGNPWLNIWQHKTNLVATNTEQLNRIPNFNKYSRRILFTLQPYYANYGLFSWILDVIKIFPDWLWLIRLHPNMHNDRNAIKNILSGFNNVEIEYATDLPLPCILRNVDVHVTHSSSTVIEAEYYGILSIVLNEMGRELYLDKIESNRVKVAFGSEQLISLLNEKPINKSQSWEVVDFEKSLRMLLKSVNLSK
ncbi:MAG: hypothetical protein ABFD08_02255 [Syntrophomonas sp.]